MRGGTWVLLIALTGCTRLNSAFGESQGTASGGGTSGDGTVGMATSSGTGTTTSDTATQGSGSNTSPSSSSSGVEPDSTSATAGTPSSSSGDTGGQGVSTTTGGDSSGEAEDRVVFIYAAAGWMDEDNVLPDVSPDEHCANNLSGAMGLCESEPVALLRQPGLSLPQIIDLVENSGWADDPVFGAGSDGSTPLADSPEELLGDLNITLSDGAVTDPNGNGLFFSGGVGPAMETCEGWQSQDAGVVGSIGSFASSVDWFASGSISCNTDLPILCACRSGPGPFE